MRTRRAALTQDVIDRDSQAIAQRLLALPFFSTPRIDRWLRITIGTPEQMERFFTALDEILPPKE